MDRDHHRLTVTRIALAEVVMAVGYDDPACLSRLFRNHAGVPPLRYCQECVGHKAYPQRH